MTCVACGLHEESDDDELTDEARNAFYAAEGRWSLVLDEPGDRVTEAMRVLQRLLSIDARDLLVAVRERRPLVVGAMVELDRVSDALEPLGARFVREAL